MVKCVRCGKDLGHADASNAKYIMNANDRRTWGKVKVEKVVKAPLLEMRIDEIMKQLKIDLKAFLKFNKTFPDELGRREVVREVKVEVPKTAIICLNCVHSDDKIIW